MYIHVNLSIMLKFGRIGKDVKEDSLRFQENTSKYLQYAKVLTHPQTCKKTAMKEMF